MLQNVAGTLILVLKVEGENRFQFLSLRYRLIVGGGAIALVLRWWSR